LQSRKLITASLIALFAIQLLNPAYSIVEITPQENSDKKIVDQQTITRKPSINTKISLDEKITKVQANEISLYLVEKPQIAKTITMSENMVVANNKDNDDGVIHLVKKENNFALLERIFGKRKQSLDNVLGVSQHDSSIEPLQYDTMEVLDNSAGVEYYTRQHFPKNELLALTNEITDIQNIFVNSFTINELTKALQPQLQFTKDVLNPSSPVLFVFAFSAIYLIIRSEDQRLKIQNYRQILSITFAIVLLSSTVTIPLSISDSYYAHAEEIESSPEAIGPPSTSFGPQDSILPEIDESLVTSEPTMQSESTPIEESTLSSSSDVIDNIPNRPSHQLHPNRPSHQLHPNRPSHQLHPNHRNYANLEL